MKNSVGIIPIFISHMGCPNDCVFCNQRKINGVTCVMQPEEIPGFAEKYISSLKRDQIELAFFGGSFTGIDLMLQEKYLFYAKKLKDEGKIHRIRLSTRPDYIHDAVIQLLKTYEVDLVELGCQSFDDDVLKFSKRGHDAAAIDRAIMLLKKQGIRFGIQLMLGLPGDDYDKFYNSLNKTIDLKPDCVRLYPALVIKDTELEVLYEKGLYAPLTLEEAVKWTAVAFKKLTQHEITVIRMGLQRTDLIDFDGAVIAGPFHPSFGEMVMTRLFYESIIRGLEQLITEANENEMDSRLDESVIVNAKTEKNIENCLKPSLSNRMNTENWIVYVHPKQISAAIGNKKSNIDHVQSYLKNVSLQGVVRFLADENIRENELKIFHNGKYRLEHIINN